MILLSNTILAQPEQDSTQKEKVDSSSFTSETPDTSANNTFDSTKVEIKDIEISFVKAKVEHGPDSLYFNICLIKNTTQNTRWWFEK